MVGVRKKRATEGQPETPNETRNRMREREREEIKREINGFARISFYDLGKSSLDHIRRRRLVDEGGRLDSSSYVRCNPKCLLGVFLFPSFCLFLKKRKKEEKILFGATRSFCISMSSRSLKRKQNRNLSLSPATAQAPRHLLHQKNRLFNSLVIQDRYFLAQIIFHVTEF